MPGARTAALEPIPPELLGADRPPDDREAHVAAMRRLLAIAMTRARERLVLAYPERGEKGEPLQPSPFLEEATAAAGLELEDREEELFGPAESLHATFRMMRDELLDTVSRTGGRLSELRLDTDLDVSHAVVRYLELLKLSALLARPDDQDVADALPEINARLARAVTAEQREIFQTSVLDEYLLDAERDARRRAAATTAREEPSLEAFLPAAARDWRFRPPTWRPTGSARCATSSRGSSASLRSRLSTSASGSSSTRSSSASTPAGGHTRWPSCSACSTRAGAAAASGTPTRSASCARRPRTR
jgi:hypothetical protein